MIFTRVDEETHMLQTVFTHDAVNRITVQHLLPLDDILEKELLVLLRTFSRSESPRSRFE